MAQRSYSVTAKVDPRVVWEHWTNVDLWAGDDPGIEAAKLNGPLAKGAMGWVKRRGHRKASFRIAEVDRQRMRFTIEGRRPLVTLTLAHQLERPEPQPADDGAGVRAEAAGHVLTHTLTVKGLLAPVWERILGDQIVSDLPTVTGNIVRAASA